MGSRSFNAGYSAGQGKAHILKNITNPKTIKPLLTTTFEAYITQPKNQET